MPLLLRSGSHPGNAASSLRANTSPRDGGAYVLGVVAVLLGATLLRLLAIDDEGFWFDELWIWRQMQLSWSELMHDMVYEDVHPPLYNALLWLWARVFGDDELSLRLPSVLFGVAAVAMVMRLAHILRGRRMALIAGVVLGVSEYAVFYAQEARSYSLMLFFGALMACAFFTLLQRYRHRSLALFVMAGLGLLYTHVFGALVVATFGLGYLLLRWRGRQGAFSMRPWLLSQVAIALGFVPWLPAFFEQASRVQSGFWIPELGPLFFAQFFAKFSGNAALGLLAAALLLGLLGQLVFSRRQAQASPQRSAAPEQPPPSDAELLFFGVGWYALLLGVPYLVSLLGEPILHAKSAITVLVPMALLIALAIERLPRRIGALALMGWVLLSLYANVFATYLPQNREAWREMTTAVEADYDAQRDLVVLYHPDYDYFYCYRYYLDPQIPAVDLLCAAEACEAPLAKLSLRPENREKRRLWLLKMRASDDFPAGLDGRWRLERREQFNNGVLDVLVR